MRRKAAPTPEPKPPTYHLTVTFTLPEEHPKSPVYVTVLYAESFLLGTVKRELATLLECEQDRITVYRIENHGTVPNFDISLY